MFRFNVVGNQNNIHHQFDFDTLEMSNNARLYVESYYLEYSNTQIPHGIIQLESDNCLVLNSRTSLPNQGNSTRLKGYIQTLDARSTSNFADHSDTIKNSLGITSYNILQNKSINIRFSDAFGELIPDAEMPDYYVRFIIIDSR